jgi:hypothetical protein
VSNFVHHLLPEQVRDKLRVKRDSIRTECAYVDWIER